MLVLTLQIPSQFCNLHLGAGRSCEEVVAVDLTLEGAADAREALSKALYANLFRWLVERVNLALAPPARLAVVKLSILDIYGFECFEENAFEQLCINFANESLQQLFNRSHPVISLWPLDLHTQIESGTQVPFSRSCKQLAGKSVLLCNCWSCTHFES